MEIELLNFKKEKELIELATSKSLKQVRYLASVAT